MGGYEGRMHIAIVIPRKAFSHQERRHGQESDTHRTLEVSG
jgi:hypothetical protein